ncbi:hypothetical protein VCRA2128O305_230026 [Vibrio crassostreae]|nr:hypothetical protein VCRA2119O145_100026 [Vibrio crassostreae]CAK1707530.1 hypothetical protein VCRA2112O189_100149 [Vibrio crassostreae]CAK1712753.1 hypothetical protein VCRA2113O212_110025 [Vibrio crassostreae]CAK1775468.1 hypothetical protein VCRA2112O187_130025 [Vibrio crassostreae]CAK1784426.1 hypothetical protein VCRA2114E122_150105 [Vibrio crassostreae]
MRKQQELELSKIKTYKIISLKMAHYLIKYLDLPSQGCRYENYNVKFANKRATGRQRSAIRYLP